MSLVEIRSHLAHKCRPVWLAVRSGRFRFDSIILYYIISYHIMLHVIRFDGLDEFRLD